MVRRSDTCGNGWPVKSRRQCRRCPSPSSRHRCPSAVTPRSNLDSLAFLKCSEAGLLRSSAHFLHCEALLFDRTLRTLLGKTLLLGTTMQHFTRLICDEPQIRTLY